MHHAGTHAEHDGRNRLFDTQKQELPSRARVHAVLPGASLRCGYESGLRHNQALACFRPGAAMNMIYLMIPIYRGFKADDIRFPEAILERRIS